MIPSLREFRNHDGLDRWQTWTEWPLIVLGLAFLVVLILPLATPLTATEEGLLRALNITIWVVFVFDYVTRLYLARARWPFVRTHVLDLIVIAVPFLRPFRALRLIAIVVATSRRVGEKVIQRVTIYVASVALIVTATSAVIVYDSERQAKGANITSLTDAFWWAVTTVTTVGYGDRYPVTDSGRVMAALLMFTGIALVGTITAAVAASFVNMTRGPALEQAQVDREQLAEQLAHLTNIVESLRNDVIGTRTTTVADAPDGFTGPHDPA